jgi:hypothetical protein
MAKKSREDKYIDRELNDMKKTQIEGNIEDLQGNINSLLGTLEGTDDLMPDDVLPDLNIANIQVFDYEKEMESIKIDSKETLSCLANLYLDEEIMKDKNVNLIIRDDAMKIAELNFSISISKRALILLMQQIDMGTTNAELYKSVFEAQREMRETIKSAHDLLNVKMKTFYQNLREEIESKGVNTGDDILEDDGMNIISDPKKLNKMIEEFGDGDNIFNDED